MGRPNSPHRNDLWNFGPTKDRIQAHKEETKYKRRGNPLKNFGKEAGKDPKRIPKEATKGGFKRRMEGNQSNPN